MKRAVIDVELWKTEDVLQVWERLVGRLAVQSKRRIIAAARASGWDRTWEEPAR